MSDELDLHDCIDDILQLRVVGGIAPPASASRELSATIVHCRSTSGDSTICALSCGSRSTSRVSRAWDLLLDDCSWSISSSADSSSWSRNHSSFTTRSVPASDRPQNEQFQAVLALGAGYGRRGYTNSPDEGCSDRADLSPVANLVNLMALFDPVLPSMSSINAAFVCTARFAFGKK